MAIYIKKGSTKFDRGNQAITNYLREKDREKENFKKYMSQKMQVREVQKRDQPRLRSFAHRVKAHKQTSAQDFMKDS